MVDYKLSKERLLEVLVKVYETGWSGPLDLAESFALSLIEDELEDVKCIRTENQLTFPFVDTVASDSPSVIPSNYQFPIDVNVTNNELVTVAIEDPQVDWSITTSLE